MLIQGKVLFTVSTHDLGWRSSYVLKTLTSGRVDKETKENRNMLVKNKKDNLKN